MLEAMERREAGEMEEDYSRCGGGGLLRWQAMLSSSRLASTQPTRFPELRDTLTYRNPFWRIFDYKSMNSFKSLLKRLVELLICVFTMSIVINYSLLVIQEYQRDSLLIDWKPITNNLMAKCNTSDPKLFTDHLDMVRTKKILESTRQIMNSLNYMYFSNGNCLVSHVFIISIMFGYFYAGLIIGRSKLRVHFIGFLCNPKLERLLAKVEIDLIFDELIESVGSTIANITRSFQLCNNNKDQELQYKQQFCSMIARNQSTRRSTNCDVIKLNYKKIYKDLLEEIRKLHLVKPLVLTECYHKFVVVRYKQFVCSTALLGFLTSICFFGSFMQVELHERVKTRLNYYNCKPETSLTEFIYFSLLDELPEEDKREYLAFGSEIERIKIFPDYLRLLRMEFDHYLYNNRGTLAKSVLVISIAYYCHMVMWFFASLHIFIHLDKMFWVGQIKQQLARVIRLMNELNESNFAIRVLADFEGEQNRKLYAKIAVAFVNFELLRKRHKNFQLFASLLMLVTLIVMIPIVLIVTMSLKLIPVASKFPLYLALTYLVIYANVYLVPSAMFMNKMQELRVFIMRLLASSKKNNFRYCHLMSSWLRQLKCPDETNHIFAPSIYGLYLCYDKLIRINVYLFAFYCVLYMNRRVA